MTDPVERIDPARGPGKKNAAGTRLKHELPLRHADETETDSVDISDEARERATGKHHRTILEYLQEPDA